jgi:hypothetical protein
MLRCGLASLGSGYEHFIGCCGNGDKPSGTIKGG